MPPHTIPKALCQQAYLRQIGEKYDGKCKTRWCRQPINPFSYFVILDKPNAQVHLDSLVVVCKACHEICTKTSLGFNEHTNNKSDTNNTKQGCIIF